MNKMDSLKEKLKSALDQIRQAAMHGANSAWSNLNVKVMELEEEAFQLKVAINKFDDRFVHLLDRHKGDLDHEQR